MRITLHGVRGSTPATGATFVRTGGDTSCVSVTPSGAPHPTLLLDAGTGLSDVTRVLGDRPYEGAILLTHLHWDHVQGLPFFQAGDRDDAVLRLLLPAQQGAAPGVAGSAEALLARSMSPPHFPITPRGLHGRWSFDAFQPGTFEIGGCRVTAAEVPHKGGRTFGYRVEADGRSLVYLPDHDPTISPDPGIGLARGADLLLHDASFTAAEAPRARSYGHSTIAEALELARSADVRRLALVHHAPSRTDDQIDALASALPHDLEIIIGREGDELDV